MSVFIKGMEMPESCILCRLECLYRIHNSGSRSKYCPLMEIKTPHGRLIDADDLIIGLELHAEAHPSDSIVRTEAESTIGAIIDEPTVIEAEVE